MNADVVRRKYLVIAEVLDVLRVVPRLLVTGYGYLVWDTVQWYQALPEPSTQHTALVSAIVGASAMVFGFYTNTGTNWDRGFVSWDPTKAKTQTEDAPAPSKPTKSG